MYDHGIATMCVAIVSALVFASAVSASETIVERDVTWPISQPDQTFTLDVAGDLDRANTWYIVPYTIQHPRFDVSRSMRLENRGANILVHPRIRANGRSDWWDINDGLADIIDPGMTDREKALAIGWHVLRHRYHTYGDTRETIDPVKFLNVFGYGWCTESAQALVNLWKKAGLQARFYSIWGHDVSEVWYDGGWHLFDADGEVFIDVPDRVPGIGIEDIANDHALALFVPPYGSGDPWLNSSVMAQRYAAIFGGREKADVTFGIAFVTEHTMALQLRPDESFTWYWTPQARYVGPTEYGGYARVPEYYGTGRFEYVPDFTTSRWRTGATEASNVQSRSEDGLPGPLLHVAASGQPGILRYDFESPYVFVDGVLNGIVSVSNGGSVTLTVERFRDTVDSVAHTFTATGTYPFSIPLVDLIAPTTQSASYNVAVEIAINGSDTGIDSLAVVLDTQLAPESLPHILLGTNDIRVTHESTEPVDALLTYQWREAHGVSLPPAPSAPIYPADSATDIPRDGAFQWTPVEHDSVNLYEIEISEYPDMRYPIGPDGNRILWTYFTSDITSYTVPMPSRFESGRTYYWRVRAGKYNRWWGPWSDVWSVSFVGPAAPTDAHIDDSDGLTLRWTPTATGTQPAFYEVYADTVEDFIPETGGYQWLLESNAGGSVVCMRAPNLIDTVHTPEYRIDFASLGLIPVEFRVIAVDGNNTRSTFTAPIRLHPYAQPDSMHVVKTGTEWRYRPVTSSMISRLEHMESTGYVERETDRIEWTLLDAPTWINLADGELVGTPPVGSSRDTISVTMEGASALTGRTVEHAVTLAIIPSDDPLDPGDIPESIGLAVTPNPFEVSAKIVLSVPESAVVTVSVFNASGAHVTTLIDNVVLPAREHQFVWEPGNLASGIYFIRADIGGKLITARTLFVR